MAMVPHAGSQMTPHGPTGMLPHGYPPGAMQPYAAPGQPVVFNIQGGSASASSAASVSPQIIIMKKPFSHGLHLFLSILTCGLWVPVWIIAYIMYDK